MNVNVGEQQASLALAGTVTCGGMNTLQLLTAKRDRDQRGPTSEHEIEQVCDPLKSVILDINTVS